MGSFTGYKSVPSASPAKEEERYKKREGREKKEESRAGRRNFTPYAAGQGRRKMKGKRRKKEEGGIPSREAQCTPYAAGQGKSRQREQEERNQKKESDITAPKYFDR